MSEEYIGTKFKTLFAGKSIPAHEQTGSLISWGRRFSELGLAPGGSGNVSFRMPEGFIVSRTGSNLGLLKPADLVHVLRVDVGARQVTVIGTHEPSSESMMHAAIYAARPEVGAILHGHSERMLEAAERLGLPVTESEQPYGTPEVVSEILKVLGASFLVLIRNHGFVALGETMAQAGRVTEAVLARLLDARR